MSKGILSEDTIIEIGKSIPLSKYEAFFKEATGKNLPGSEFKTWLSTQSGKKLKDACAEYCNASERKNISERLAEQRFDYISEHDKAFIIAFDEGIGRLGYDYGGGIGEGYCWGKNMVIYSKTGVKAKKVAARIFIREDCIVLRLFFNNIDKHRAFLENAPEHIKDVFLPGHGDCNHCKGIGHREDGNCSFRKAYTLDGSLIEKCAGVVFEFHQPNIEKLPDYLALLGEFYPTKGRK